MTIVNMPKPFDGTEEQRRANYRTHRFLPVGGEFYCDNCEAKPWHVAASYPCGAFIPRIDITLTSEEAVSAGAPGWVEWMQQKGSQSKVRCGYCGADTVEQDTPLEPLRCSACGADFDFYQYRDGIIYGHEQPIRYGQLLAASLGLMLAGYLMLRLIMTIWS